MKKILILLSMLITVMFIIGCGPSDLPPEPGAPGSTGSGALAGQATGEAWCTGTIEGVNFVLTPDELIVEEGDSGLIQTELTAPLVYDICYYYDELGGDWVDFELVGNRVLTLEGDESNWIDETASGEEMIPADVLTEAGGVVACYSCIWDDIREEYDCCGDRWMPRTFEVEINPAACAQDLDCLPGVCDIETGDCVECITSNDCGGNLVCSGGVCGGRPLPAEPTTPSFLIPETGTDGDSGDTAQICEDSDFGLIIAPEDYEGDGYDLLGDSIYTSGTLTNADGIHTDGCVQVGGESHLEEWVCYQFAGEPEILSAALPLACPYGYGCVDGACQVLSDAELAELACEDSDEHIDTLTPGYIEFNRMDYQIPTTWGDNLVDFGGGKYRAYDHDGGDNKVQEVYCLEEPTSLYGYWFTILRPCGTERLVIETEEGAYCGTAEEAELEASRFCIDSNDGYLMGDESATSYVDVFPEPDSSMNPIPLSDGGWRVYDFLMSDGMIRDFVCDNGQLSSYETDCDFHLNGLSVIEDEKGAYCG